MDAMWNGDEVVQNGRRSSCVSGRDAYALKRKRGMGDLHFEGEKARRGKLKGGKTSQKSKSAAMLGVEIVIVSLMAKRGTQRESLAFG